jgi:hypothetical protein
MGKQKLLLITTTPFNITHASNRPSAPPTPMPFFSLLQTLAFLQDGGSHTLRASRDPDAQSRSAAASNGRHGAVRCAGTRRGAWVDDCYVDLW